MALATVWPTRDHEYDGATAAKSPNHNRMNATRV